MKVVSSYPVRLSKLTKEQRRLLENTDAKYNEAVRFLLPIIDSEWNVIAVTDDKKLRQRICETLIHETKTNPKPKYPEFDEKFENFPCYYRRAAVTAAIGAVSSYKSNYQNWLDGGQHGEAPKLGVPHQPAPFYNANMFSWDDSYPTKAKLKVLVDDKSTWGWIEVDLRLTDVQYIKHHCSEMVRSVPTLRKKGKVWSLSFAFTINVSLTDAAFEDQRILGVDLGVNTDATVVVMESDGTVIARKFIDFASDKGSMYHRLGYVRRAQSHGSRNLSKMWQRVNDANEQLSIKISKAIVDAAIKYSCDVIVMEYLDMTGKIRGSQKQRLTIWRKRDIQKRVEHLAHRCGMRFSRVCAWNTSRLAFDGSGRVKRGSEIAARDGVTFGYGTVEFSSGKLYSADLNAAYNIGARYFVRGILKALSEKSRSALEAKVPFGLSGSTVTLASLISLNKELGGHACQGTGNSQEAA